MLSHLDHIIFPDRCVVYEIIPSQRYFYPIFKNGSSSIKTTSSQRSWKILLNEQIKKAQEIEVVIRDPEARLQSGINTFVQQVKAENPDLDLDTIIWFSRNYLFLNRHYCPQFLWLVNLSRYVRPDCKLYFRSMEDLQDIADYNHKPPGIQDGLVKPDSISQSEMYQRIDMILLQCIGKSLSFGELLNYIRQEDLAAYNYVIERSKKILEPIYVLS